MKKYQITTLVLLIACLFSTALIAQDAEISIADTLQTEPIEILDTATTAATAAGMSNVELFARKLVGSYLVQLFVEGGWVMWPMLILALWGIAMVIWKLVALSYGKVNLNAFLNQIVPLVKEKKYAEAAEIAKNTRGPIASITYAAMMKANIGTEALEKAIENSAIIEMAFLEKGFIAINTTINLAPMFGFFGTIVGMIEAFAAIAAAGEVDPTIVATGIQVALITTMAGLAIAIPVHFLNNVLLSMVDGFVLDMQRTTDKIVETYVENK